MRSYYVWKNGSCLVCLFMGFFFYLFIYSVFIDVWLK